MASDVWLYAGPWPGKVFMANEIQMFSVAEKKLIRVAIGTHRAMVERAMNKETNEEIRKLRLAEIERLDGLVMSDFFKDSK